MKKLFLSLIASLALVLAPGLQAQNNLPTATTVTANVSAATDYFQIVLTGNVTTFGFTFGSEAPTARRVFVVFTQDGTGSRTVGFATNVKGVTIGSSASETTVEEFFYDITTGIWYAIASQHT
jgi:hypothetical protein